MEKNSTLLHYMADTRSADTKLKNNDNRSQPKASTIHNLCMFARVAFSDTALAGVPAIVLN